MEIHMIICLNALHFRNISYYLSLFKQIMMHLSQNMEQQMTSMALLKIFSPIYLTASKASFGKMKK